MANSWGADLFLSIHCNAYDGKAHGTETLVYNLNSEAAEVAAKVQQAVVKRLGTTDRGVKERRDLGVLRLTKCPAILIETAFIDNENDAWLLKTKTEDFAQAICGGIGVKEGLSMARTVMQLPEEVYIQEIAPADGEILKNTSENRRIHNVGVWMG